MRNRCRVVGGGVEEVVRGSNDGGFCIIYNKNVVEFDDRWWSLLVFGLLIILVFGSFCFGLMDWLC